MDPSQGKDTPSGRHLEDIDTGATTPTETRNPLGRSESSAGREGEGLSESFQSTDTVRRRTEMGYGL